MLLKARERTHLMPIPHNCDRLHLTGQSNAFKKMGNMSYFRSFFPFSSITFPLHRDSSALAHLPTCTHNFPPHHQPPPTITHRPLHATAGHHLATPVLKTAILPYSSTCLSPTFTKFYNFFVFDNCTLLAQSVVALSIVGFLVFCRGLDNF
jgi:hypothetical protein